MMVRNRMLVERSGICVCYLNKEGGGTAYTVKYAQKMSIPIINITPHETDFKTNSTSQN